MPQLCENSQNKLGEDFGELWRILEGFENFPKFSSSYYNIYSQNKENLSHKLFPYPPNTNSQTRREILLSSPHNHILFSPLFSSYLPNKAFKSIIKVII
jgi:hypothetical protein